jgi:hypothetical protein
MLDCDWSSDVCSSDLWVAKGREAPKPVNLRLGVSYGKATEILRGDITEGAGIVLGIEEGAAKRQGAGPRPFGMGM